MKLPAASAIGSAAWHYLVTPTLMVAASLGTLALIGHSLGATSDSDAAFRASTAAAGYSAALALIALQAALGWQLFSAFRWHDLFEASLERGLFAWVAGFVITSGGALLLAAAGLLNRGSVVLLFGVSTLACAPTLLSAARELSRSQLRAWRGFDRERAAELAAAALLLAIALFWLWPLILQTLLPNSDWDSALYHLPLADRYLDGRLWNYDPVFSAYSFPGAVSLLYAVFLSVGLESAIIPFNFIIAILTIVATASLGARLGGPRTGALAAAILSSTHILWQLGVDPRIDGVLSLLVLASVYAFSSWMLCGRRPQYLYLVGLSLGGALGCKYSALLYSAGIGGAALVALLWQARGQAPRVLAAQAATLAFVFAFPHGAWYAANLTIHGDPVYAMLRGHYVLGPLGEARYLVEELEPRLAEIPHDPSTRGLHLRMKSTPNQIAEASLFDLRDILVNPGHYSPKPNHFASPLLLGFLLLPVLLALRRWRGPDARDERALLVLYSVWGIGFYCAVATQIPILRYQLPLFPLFAVGTAVAVTRIRNPLWQGAWALAAIAVLVSNALAERERIGELQVELYLSGEASRIEWLSQVGYNGERSTVELIQFVNQRIESGSMKPSDRILMIGEGKGRLLQCEYEPDSSWSLERWLGELLNADFDYPELRRRLRERGITHILYNRGYYDWVLLNTETRRDLLALGVSHLRRFLREYGTEIYDERVMRLVEL